MGRGKRKSIERDTCTYLFVRLLTEAAYPELLRGSEKPGQLILWSINLINLIYHFIHQLMWKFSEILKR